MRPLVYILFAYVAGILSASLFALAPALLYLLFSISVLILPVFYLLKRPFKPAIIMPCFFFLGIIAINARTNIELPPDHIANLIRASGSVEDSSLVRLKPDGYEDIKCVVLTSEIIGTRSRVLVDVKQISRNGRWKDATGKTLITVNGKIEALPNDTVRILARLYKPENFGNPGEYDYKSHLNMSGIFAVGYVKSPSYFIITGSNGRSITSFIAQTRSTVRRFLTDNSKEHGVLNALVIADKGGLSRKTRAAFAATGTSHILSISGLHIAIVGGFFYAVAMFFLKRAEYTLLAVNAKKVAVGAALISILIYATMADFPYATQRAAGMALVIALSLLMARGHDIYNSLAFAALAILAWTPTALREISFQLTFAAVLAIAYLVPRLTEIFVQKDADKELKNLKERSAMDRFYKNRLLPAILVTLSSSIGVSPILAYHFHRVALTGLLANLIAIPISACILVLTLLSSALSFLYEPIAVILLYPTDLLTMGLSVVISFFASLPFSSVWVSTPTLTELSLFYMICYVAFNFNRGRYYRYALILLITIAVTDVIYLTARPAAHARLIVDYLSVGQGESELIRFPNGQT
ncbi:MAG: ComEC family competence protein, partial [Nitrospirota bacterium]|nr:ComEC family competence protein [Nitrospirota bacterium]